MVESLLPGSTLGRYQVVEAIGRGGMASVFRAHDPELNRFVAIKVLPSFHADDPTFVQRFRQEAQAVARLSHPNVIQVHDFGEDKGFTYIVMEYVTGGKLQDVIKEKTSLGEVRDLISPVADALGYAHDQGIVHRDVKPANVLMEPDGKPVLTDFGLARMLEGSVALTRADSVLGTPEYMAPEQALGRPVDHRSDLYSLGIIVYQMVLGQTPFRRDTPSETLMAHIHQPLPLPSTLDPDADPLLEAILVKALAKNPDDRYQSAGDLVQALSSVSAEAPGMSADTTQATIVGKRPDTGPKVGPSSTGADSRSSAGQAEDLISLDRACILAIRLAREEPGEYGSDYKEVPMAFEVVSQEESEEYYVVTLSIRPQGSFAGAPGEEQFFIGKDGTIDHRQVLALPAPASRRGIPV